MPPPQDNARLVILIILLLWYTSNPNDGPGFAAAPNLTRARLSRQRSAHGVLNSTKWGDFSPHQSDDQAGASSTYLNLTGFRAQDGFGWDDLGKFRDRCDSLAKRALGQPEHPEPVWQNATGVVQGLWTKSESSATRFYSSYNLSEITPEVEWLGKSAEWSRNVTGTEGKVLIRIEDDANSGTEPEQLDDKSIIRPEVRAREVSATVTVDDDAGLGSSFDMRVHGVHWPRQGAMLFTTTSEKFAGIFGLPHLTPGPEFFKSSQALLNRTLDTVLRKKERRAFVDPSNPWSSSLGGPGEGWALSPHCEFLIYVQVHPLDKSILKTDASIGGQESALHTIETIENELRFPQGAPHQATPKLQMSAVIYSPDCAFLLGSKGPPEYAQTDGNHLVGVKQEVFLYSINTWLLSLALVIFAQSQLLGLQMRETSTPSTLGRVSFYTAGMMLLADGVIFFGSATWSLTASTTLFPSLAVTCACFLSTTTGVSFLNEVYRAQESEWRRPERTRQQIPAATPARPASTPRTTTPASTGTAPASRPPNLQVSTTNLDRIQTPPIIIPSDQDIDAEIAENTNTNTTAPALLPAPVTTNNNNAQTAQQSSAAARSTLFGRLFMLGICLLFLSLAASSWPSKIRSGYFNTLAFLYLSMWTPQIYRNVYRNCRRALSWQYVIGQSLLRLLPIAYFYLLKDNFAFAEPDRKAFLVLAGWVWIQIWILVAQSVVGPRFGLPNLGMPEAWEYHPVLREDNIEAGGLPIGLVSAPGSPTLERVKTGEDRDKKPATVTRVIECAICREDIEVPVIRAGVEDPTNGGVAGMFARRTYMVTPCRHIFHSKCLEGWMRFRLQCPICREELPPL